jgi:hypothetical protein
MSAKACSQQLRFRTSNSLDRSLPGRNLRVASFKSASVEDCALIIHRAHFRPSERAGMGSAPVRQQLRDGRTYALAARFLVEGEAWRRIHFEAIPFARRRAAQVDARKGKIQ